MNRVSTVLRTRGMRVAVDIESLSSSTPSGVGHYVLGVLEGIVDIAPTDIELLLYSTGRARPHIPQHILDAPFVHHMHRSIPNKLVHAGDVLGIFSLKKLFAIQPDLVWLPNAGFAHRTSAPVVLTVHDLAWHLMPETYTRFHHLRYRLTKSRTQIQRADKIIAVSHSTAHDVRKEFHRAEHEVDIIHHGIDHQAFHPRTLPQDTTIRQKLGLKKPYIISLATREPRKNLASLIEAFDAIQEFQPDLDLVIVGGSGWKNQDLETVLDRSLHRDSVKLLDYIEDSHRPAILRGATCLCLPSRYEGFGMQVIEAMACGIPVITSPNSSLGELVQSAALTPRSMDVAELTMTLDALLKSPQLQADLCAKGLARATKFSWRHCAAAHLNTFRAQ